jgi:ribonucleoside-diphosphate reductase alpha chain
MDLKTAILKERYLQPNETSADDMYRRVARTVSKVFVNVDYYYSRFYEIMRNERFLPNSPALMNAGTRLGQLSACFVLPVEDSIEGIFETAKKAAVIQKTGGGTGFNFSQIRPEGSLVESTGGKASGVLSFMEVFDKVTDCIKQGGKRRGANMGVLEYDHPEISSFMRAKVENRFRNFNLSVGLWGSPKDFELEYELGVCAWRSGDPGVLFLNRINEKNPTPEYGKIVATNPCGEVPLLPHESCNLGSINLTKYVEKNGEFNIFKLKNDVETAVELLDAIISVNKYPFQEIRDATLRTRKIGLGVMGFADMLIMMGINYNDTEAVNIATQLSYDISRFARLNNHAVGRIPNKTLTSIAPTGTISRIAGVSNGIEPNFAGEYTLNVMDRTFKIKHPLKEDENFVTAYEVPPEQHVKIQAAWQEHVDNSVSKTVNLPNDATVDDVIEIYRLAYRLGCKGITIYRDGSNRKQPLVRCEEGRCAL